MQRSRAQIIHRVTLLQVVPRQSADMLPKYSQPLPPAVAQDRPLPSTALEQRLRHAMWENDRKTEFGSPSAVLLLDGDLYMIYLRPRQISPCKKPVKVPLDVAGTNAEVAKTCKSLNGIIANTISHDCQCDALRLRKLHVLQAMCSPTLDSRKTNRPRDKAQMCVCVCVCCVCLCVSVCV